MELPRQRLPSSLASLKTEIASPVSLRCAVPRDSSAGPQAHAVAHKVVLWSFSHSGATSEIKDLLMHILLYAIMWGL